MSKFDFRSKFQFRCPLCFLVGLLLVGLGSPLAFGQTQTAPKPNAPVPRSTGSAADAPAAATGEDPASSPFGTPRKLLREGKFDDAIATLEDLQTKNPAMPGLSHELGVAYYKKGDYLKAIAALKKAETDKAEDANDTIRQSEAMMALVLVDHWLRQKTTRL